MNNLFVKLFLTSTIIFLTSCAEKSGSGNLFSPTVSTSSNPAGEIPVAEDGDGTSEPTAEEPNVGIPSSPTLPTTPNGPVATAATPSEPARPTATTPNTNTNSGSTTATTPNTGNGPLLRVPSFSAQTLSQRINDKWLELKNKKYTVTSGGVAKSLSYFPADTKMAYCFPDYKNEQIFSNYDPYRTGLEIASVSKIFTSLWAIEAQKRSYILLPKQFKTEVSFNHETGELFIRGSLDPLFGIDRLEDALKKIQRSLTLNGYSQKLAVQKVHIYNFIQLPIYTSQTGYEMVVADQAQNLAITPALTTRSITNVAKYLKNQKNSFFRYTNFENFQVINYSDRSRYVDVASNARTKITSMQRPLSQLLYFVNTFSHNLGSDLLYQLLGGKEEFINFLVDYLPANLSSTILNGEEDMSQHLGYDPRVPFIFYNGSGLPLLLKEEAEKARSAKSLSVTAFTDATEDQFGNAKFRNKATCQIIFKTMEGLNNSKSFFSTNLEDLLAVNGTGTLHRAVSKEIPMGTFAGKTGSLNNLLAVAGALKTPYGLRPFFISVFRNNLDVNGQYRPNGLNGNAATFMRSTLTLSMVKLMLEYYTQQGIFMPRADILAQLNVNTFLAQSYDSVNSLNAFP